MTRATGGEALVLSRLPTGATESEIDMAEVETVEEQLRRWNPRPSEDHRMQLVVGTSRGPGDTRATSHPDLEDVNRHIAAARGQSTSDDDLSSDEYGDEFDDMSADELRDEAEKRDLPKSGSKADLRRRVREHDLADEDDDEDDDEE